MVADESSGRKPFLTRALSDALALSPRERDDLQESINRSMNRPFFEGSSVILKSLPFLSIRIPETIGLQDDALNDTSIVTGFWGDSFGSSLTFSLSMKDSRIVSKVIVYRDDPAFIALKDGRYIITLVQGSRIIKAGERDIIADDTSASYYRKGYAEVENATPIIPDRDAHYWSVQGSLRARLIGLTRNDKLSIGWIKSYNAAVNQALHCLQQAATVGMQEIPKEKMAAQSVSLLETLEGEGFRLNPVVEHIMQGMKHDTDYLQSVLGDLRCLRQFFDCPVLCNAAASAYVCASMSSALTKSGRRLTWLNASPLSLMSTDIDASGFPNNIDPQEYWSRVPEEYRLNWGSLISGTDIPISPESLALPISNLPLADDITEANAEAEALLDEAATNKKWTIPNKAIIQLEFGPFSYVEASEINDEVAFVCRTSNNEFLIIWVNPKDKNCTFHASAASSEPDEADESLIGRAEAGVKLLLSAIVRDFWVVEQRERVFSTRIDQRRRGRPSDDKPVIVYLPRIEYTGQANINTCERELGHEERKAHSVRPHLRKAENPSADQLILAQRYNFIVPKGYTFVKPHERGKIQRDVIYRSRSALQSLYTVIERQGDADSDWFAFEKDVYKLMVAIGYTVEHVSASRRGDNGVDIYATQAVGESQVNWIIQCKCYAPNHKIGPNIIRELVGALANYPAGTKGMVATTSTFSNGAKEEAAKHGIRLVDGSEFLRLVESANAERRKSEPGPGEP
jgi:Restriction endonuclease